MAKAKEKENLHECAENMEATEATETTEATEAIEDVDTAKKGYVEVTVPIGFITGPEDEHLIVCLNGKNYQVKVGEPVAVPKGVKEIIDNAMAQRRKVNALKKAKSKPVEIPQN